MSDGEHAMPDDLPNVTGAARKVKLPIVAAELGYIQEKTDWARVVETPDSARIVPPDRPPRIRFVDGPIGDRMSGWMCVVALTVLVGIVEHEALPAVRRVRMPVDWVDYATLGVGLFAAVAFLGLIGGMIWGLVVAALPEKCEILVHISGVVVRRFRGKWQKTEIERGGVRTVLLSTLRARQGTRSGWEPPVHATLICQGKRESVQVGRYEAALASDIAQAIVAQHERLAITPVPRLMDVAGVTRVASGPKDEPRWHRIERSAAEVQIRPTDPTAQVLPNWTARTMVAMWLATLAIYLGARLLQQEELQRGAWLLAAYAAMATVLWLMAITMRYCGRTYTLTPDALVIVTQYSMWRSRMVLQRSTIEAIRLARITDKGFWIEAAHKGGRPKVIPGGQLDAAWELAAILRKELGVPATTAEEDALGTGQATPPAPSSPAIQVTRPAQAVPGAKELSVPDRHYVQVRHENDSIIIEKPPLGPAMKQVLFVLFGVAVLLGSIIAVFVITPRVADPEGRGATLIISMPVVLWGLLIVACAIGEMIESYRFQITKTQLLMQRVLPWGTRNEQWELGQIADVRIEGNSLLVLEDWTGEVHRLVFWGHTPSIRYTAALLRKHLGEMRRD